MSRAGKNPIAVPDKVEVTLSPGRVEVKSDSYEQRYRYDPLVTEVTRMDDGSILVKPTGNGKRHRAMWGTVSRRISNMIAGVADGFEKKLELVGVGYRAQVSDSGLRLSLGYSNPVIYRLPEGVFAKVEGDRATRVTVSGRDKIQVGQVAGEIRALRPPEPYKGKGVRYLNEFIAVKEGKKK